jgi:thymidylate kinase
MAGQFLVLEGTDGIGKTTLAGLVADLSYEAAIGSVATHRPQDVVGPQPLVFAPKRQISATSAYAARLMEQLSTMLWHSGDALDLPDAFWVGLQAAWFTAHGTTVLQPLLDAGYDVITDGWIYKFCSKLLLQGYSQPDLDMIFGRVRKPDAVILLSADPTEVYDRRRRFRPAELGLHGAYQRLDRASFIDYQRSALNHLRQYAATYPGWRDVTMDLGATPAQSARYIASVIADLRVPAHPATVARTKASP